MLDGIYQSLICFYLPYLLFTPANFETSSGLSVNDTQRIGVYVACATIAVVNVYILLNTYRWDWLMILLVSISILLIWFWTGVYTAFSSSYSFYRAAPQVYGQLTFWTLTLLTIWVCLLPRFTAKAFQKIHMPRDVDIIREQIRQGKFKYLDNHEAYVPPRTGSPALSEDSQPVKPAMSAKMPMADNESQRPIYPPSVAPTNTTYNPRSQNGSDGTDYTGHKTSLERPARPSLERPRLSFDRPRPSFDRMRESMDKIRPSYEASNDFTSAALLTRIESSHSQRQTQRPVHGSSSLR
jgi:phospholipid-translocating ATPase